MADIKSALPVTDSSDGAPAATAPALAIQVGGSDGTNLRAMKVSTGGVVSVDGSATVQPVSQSTTPWTVQGPSGTAGTPSGGILTIQGVSAGTAINVAESGVWTVRTQDGVGNPITTDNSQVLTQDTINTGSQFQAISLSTTAVEAKGAAARLVNRKFITITPTNGVIYWGTTTSVTTTTGQPIPLGASLFLSFTDNVPVYVIAAATVDVRVLEGS